MTTISRGQRLSTALTITAVALTGILVAPPAVAEESSLSFDLTVSDDSTVDAVIAFTVPAANEAVLEEGCDSESISSQFGGDDDNLDISTDIEPAEHRCTYTIKGMTFSQFNTAFEPARLEHNGDEISFSMGTEVFDNPDRGRLEITFPGEVSSVSGSGGSSGGTATWERADQETETFEARAGDSGSFPLMMVLLVAAGLLVVAAGAVLLVMRSRKRAAAASAGFASPQAMVQPGPPPYQESPYQAAPGYGPPTGGPQQPAQPGQGYPTPGQ